jgi:hypothetical protein
MKATKRVEAFGRRIRGWLPGEPTMNSPVAAQARVSRTLQSFGISVGVGAVILLSAYASFQFGPAYVREQMMSPFGPGWTFLQYGCAFAAAVLYAAISIKSFNGRLLGTILRVARNAVIAVPAGFLFTIAFYSNLNPGVASCCRGIQFLNYFDALFRVGDGPLWSCLAFVVISIFGLEYTRRSRT